MHIAYALAKEKEFSNNMVFEKKIKKLNSGFNFLKIKK